MRTGLMGGNWFPHAEHAEELESLPEAQSLKDCV